MRQLVIANGDQIRIAEGDVRRLRYGVTQKAVGHIRIAVLLSLGFDCGIVAQRIYRAEHRVKNGKLGDCRNLRLLNKGDVFGIKSNCEIINRNLINAVADKLGIFKMRGQRLDVGKQNKGIIFALQAYSVLKTAYKMTEMQLACGSVAC